MKITENYHTHTGRCNHAEGAVMEYVEAADRAGLKVLGISDHIPFPDNRWQSTRMKFSYLESYEKEIEEARARFPKMEILKAFECEYFPDDHDYFVSYLKDKDYDYLIAGTHWVIGDDGRDFTAIDDYDSFKTYETQLIRSMESGLFAFMAHPDMCFGDYLKWDRLAEDFTRIICAAAERTNIPLEINGYGFRKHKVRTSAGRRLRYPLEEFWKVAAEYKIEVVCNSDAHRPEDVAGNISDAMAIAEKNGLKIADMKKHIAEKKGKLCSI
ncbi:MAG: histidinol-phosphatase [Planctomycetota bacterium]